jgi:hypothetical protein
MTADIAKGLTLLVLLLVALAIAYAVMPPHPWDLMVTRP